MSMPGFSAEASLYPKGASYRMTVGHEASTSEVVPAFFVPWGLIYLRIRAGCLNECASTFSNCKAMEWDCFDYVTSPGCVKKCWEPYAACKTRCTTGQALSAL